jgi:DNA-binding XRE family transcriptional regulator
MSNTVADLERRLALSEDEIDLLDMRLARIEDAVIGGEEVPVEVVTRLLSGENPVRVWREHRGFSLRELGRRAGVSPQLLSEIETGKKEGSLKSLRAIARELGVELDDLVPRGDNGPREGGDRSI